MHHRSCRSDEITRPLRRGALGFAAATGVLALGSLAAGGQDVLATLGGACGLLVIALVWMLRSTFYEITPTSLRICSGPVQRTIALRDVLAVHPSTDRGPAPALGLPRLRIDYHTRRGRRRGVLVSPENPDRFLADLATADASLRPTPDGGLERSASQTEIVNVPGTDAGAGRSAPR